MVEVLSTTDPSGCYSYQYHEPKQRPSDDEVKDAIQLLRANWSSLFLTEFASATFPLIFTGNKFRRLLVWADEKHIPPWGSWKHIDSLKKETFSKFRQAINKTISPVYVDHVDFIFSETKRRKLTRNYP